MPAKGSVSEVQFHVAVHRADGTEEGKQLVAYWHRNPVLRWYRCRKLGVPTVKLDRSMFVSGR